ncbi:MAG TPA: hypothetical protein DGT23_01380 [Micromonosporaceae bacterium]|nr:hypothetical protein [Micromonosporaceae bacterium]
MFGRRLLGTFTACLVLSAACTSSDPRPQDPLLAVNIPQPSIISRGDIFTADVAPDRQLDLHVPGFGHVTGPAGTVASAGKIRVTTLRSDTPSSDLMVVGGLGLDVTFQDTSLVAPLTIAFDDPAVSGLLPRNALPVVLHKPDRSDWEVKALSMAAGNVPVLRTQDFSANLFGWIPVPDWVREIGDSFADAAAQRTDARACAGDAPPWSSFDKRTTLVHLCSITNVDQATSTLRAELQVQSNRRFFQWVAVPPGQDYLWVDGQPDWLRAKVAWISKTDASQQVLLPGDGWFTAGFRQPSTTQTKDFAAYIDYTSAAFSVGTSVLGIKAPTERVHGVAFIVVKCLPKILPYPSLDLDEIKGFLTCFVRESLSNLANPDKAFRSAMDLYGDSAYAKNAQAQLVKATERLQLLGKLLRILGVGLITATFPQLPDAFSMWGNDQPGRFTYTIAAGAAGPAPAPTQTRPPVVLKGAADLYLVKTRNVPGNIEVHTRTAASGYQTGSGYTTTFGTSDAGNGTLLFAQS